MNEPLAYRVRVLDAADYSRDAPVLHEQDFEVREADPVGERFLRALKRAEDHRIHMESLFPGRFVAIDPSWEEVEV